MSANIRNSLIEVSLDGAGRPVVDKEFCKVVPSGRITWRASPQLAFTVHFPTRTPDSQGRKELSAANASGNGYEANATAVDQPMGTDPQAYRYVIRTRSGSSDPYIIIDN